MNIITGLKNEVLRAIAQPVAKFDKKLKKLVDQMKKTMVESKGVGLAAPQVGVSQRLFLVKHHKKIISLINPQILYKSEQEEIDEEGCLSLPGQWGNVSRSKSIKVKFQDLKGQTHILEFSDLSARIIQHEYDHLEGILFVDKLELSTVTTIEELSK